VSKNFVCVEAGMPERDKYGAPDDHAVREIILLLLSNSLA
jgi:hypothetical protein